MLRKTVIVAICICWFVQACLADQCKKAGSQFGFFVVTDYGAVGDGEAKDTAAIQKAIDAATAAGGGTIYFPAGKYLSVTIFFKNNVALHLEAGATLLGSTDLNDYPCIDPNIVTYSKKYIC